jgi:hypothetical protein
MSLTIYPCTLSITDSDTAFVAPFLHACWCVWKAPSFFTRQTNSSFKSHFKSNSPLHFYDRISSVCNLSVYMVHSYSHLYLEIYECSKCPCVFGGLSNSYLWKYARLTKLCTQWWTEKMKKRFWLCVMLLETQKFQILT